MGVHFDCETCNGRAGEFEEVDGEHICGDCQKRAMKLGIKILNEDKI